MKNAIRYSNGMVPYPIELRTRVVAAVAQGDCTIAEIATLFGVGTTCVKKVLRVPRAGEDLAPRHGGGPAPKVQDQARALRRSEIAKQPDATLAELQTVLAQHGRSRVSVSTLCRALFQLQLPRKKQSPRPGAGRNEVQAISTAGGALTPVPSSFWTKGAVMWRCPAGMAARPRASGCATQCLVTGTALGRPSEPLP
jgi:transposase